MSEYFYIKNYNTWYGNQVAQASFEKETKNHIVLIHQGKQRRFNKTTGKEVGGNWYLIEKSEYIEIVSKILKGKLTDLQDEIDGKQKEYDALQSRLNEIKRI